MPNKFCLFDHAISLSLIIAALSTASVVTAQENDTRQMRRGAIIITEVQGKVLIIKPGETEGKNASKAQALQQGERVMTDKDSTISLAFENGSVIQVEPETSFIVEEFLQAPWDVSEAALSEMKTEPSNSKLSTFLEYGDVTSGVKKLKPGSSLTVATPFGTAGILGTDFKVSLQRGAKGGSKGLSVAVASGEVAVATKGGATTSVKEGFSTSVSVIPSTNGQGSSMSQPTTTQIAAEVSLSILQLVRNQRTSAAQVFTNNLLERAISPSSGLNTRQTNTIEDAAAIGKEALLTTVEQLSADRVSAAPKIAAYATGLNPEAAAEIAAAAAKGASQVAVEIALAVTFTAPSQAAQIATSVATTVPNAAPRIAAVVASAVPSQAAQIAASVAAALPSAATAIARSVARAQRQQLEEIIQTTSQAVPESAASISSEVQAEAEDQGVGDGQEASSQIDLPPVIPTNPTQPPPPAPAPAPTSTPTPPTPTPPSPTATPPPTPTPTPTPTPNPSNA